MAKTKKKATTTATTETATTRSLAIVMTIPSDAPFDDGPEPEGGKPNDAFVGDGEKDEDGDEAGGNAHGDDHYEDAPPSPTDHPRPEHMVNAAVPDGRGVMIRAGSGFGSSVSDENSARPPEHVSANEKASPPAQDSHEDSHPPDGANSGFQAGRTTVDSILPLLLAAEHLVATTQHVAALHDDLKWCIDSPSRKAVETESQSLLERVAQHTNCPVPYANPPGTHTNACTDAAPAFSDPDATDARSDNRHLSDTEKGITAFFPEVTGDGAERTRLDDIDLATLVTAQQARSIGITPPTTAKLRALLQWVLDHHAASEASHADEPSGGHGKELHDFRALALTALDVAHGRMPLWTLGRYTDPRYGMTEQLFTQEEVARAQPHLSPQKRATYFALPANCRFPT